MSDPRVNLSDPFLFGNDAAEDEQEDVFNSYVVDREESSNFIDPQKRICIVRAYKGDGKSALLRLSHTKLLQAESEPLTIKCPASDLLPTVESNELSLWVRGWKGAVFGRLASAIGSRIGFAWRDDDMSLVEQAEKEGFRQRNVVSAILERVRGSASAGDVKIEFENLKPGTAHPANVVRRWAEGREPLWLIVDDVDYNFQNNGVHRARVAGFFVACRELVNAVPELRIRAAVRPNVWTTIKMEYEPLSHVEQYICDLAWSEQAIRTMLARRIEAHYTRAGEWNEKARGLPHTDWQRDRRLIKEVFEDPMEWGGGVRPPHVLLYTLSKHRPRWVIELCKSAAKRAVERGRNWIARDDIFYRLDEFGRRRIEDTVAEFRSQCPEVAELISAFNREPEQFTTARLLTVIERKILSHLAPRISGLVGEARALDVAHFLFQIGFIFPREDFPDLTYRHIPYAERPHLLRSRTAVDDGMVWEIHPVFRQALEMRDATGRELRRP
jgi:hypothetical protein